MNEEEDDVYIPPELMEDDPQTEPVEQPEPQAPEPTPMPEAPAAEPEPVEAEEPYVPEEDQQGNRALMLTKDGDYHFVAPENVESALQAGLAPAMFYVDPKKVDPTTGQPQRMAVRKQNFEAAKKAGLMPVFEWHRSQQIEKAKKEIPTTGGGAFARGAASMASLGQTANLAGGVEALREYLKSWEAKRAKQAFQTGRDVYRLEESANVEQRPGSYYGGMGAGFAATLPLSAPRTILGATAYGSAMGGIAGAGGGSEYVAPGEETPFLERTLMGAGLGGFAGAGGHKLGQVIGAKLAPKLQEIASARAVKAAQPTSLKKFARNVDRLPGGEQALGRDALRLGLIKGGDTVDDIAEKALDLQDRAGKKIGRLLQEMERSAENVGLSKFQLQNIIKRIDDEVMAPLIEEPATRPLAQKIESGYLTNLRDDLKLNQPLSFSKLHQRRSALDRNKAYNPSGIDKDYNIELQKIRNIMEDELFKGTDALAEKGGTALKSEYVKAKRAYQVGKKIAEGALEKAQNFRANRSFSVTDYMTGTGYGGTIGTAIGATLGGPVGAGVGGTIGAVTGAAANKWSREMGNPYLANIAQELANKFKGQPNAAQKILQEMNRLGMFKLSQQGE